eukprot:7799790-Lingulodinium_polyedra.AAC.1
MLVMVMLMVMMVVMLMVTMAVMMAGQRPLAAARPSTRTTMSMSTGPRSQRRLLLVAWLS